MNVSVERVWTGVFFLSKPLIKADAAPIPMDQTLSKVSRSKKYE